MLPLPLPPKPAFMSPTLPDVWRCVEVLWQQLLKTNFPFARWVDFALRGWRRRPCSSAVTCCRSPAEGKRGEARRGEAGRGEAAHNPVLQGMVLRLT